MVSCSIHVVVGGWLLSSAVKTVPAVTTIVKLLASDSGWLVAVYRGGWAAAEQSPPFLASLCRRRARIVNRGNYEGWRRMPVMGSSCPLPCTLGGTLATSRDQIACWTLPSVTMVNHIVTMVHCDSGDAPWRLHRSLCCHQWYTNDNKRWSNGPPVHLETTPGYFSCLKVTPYSPAFVLHLKSSSPLAGSATPRWLQASASSPRRSH